MCKTATFKKDQKLLDADQKYCRMLQEHSAILLIFIRLPFVITCNIFVPSIFEWPFYTGCTVRAFETMLLYTYNEPVFKLNRDCMKGRKPVVDAQEAIEERKTPNTHPAMVFFERLHPQEIYNI